jgi:Ca-activated chloride channel family protein
MSLASPIWLLAALVVPAMAGWALIQRRRRRRFAVRFPAVGTLALAVAQAPAWRRRVPPALLALAALALAVAMARPHTTVDVPVEQASVVLVTDQSGSMAADDVDPTRLAAAQGAADRFLDSVPDELLVGFVSYSTQVDGTLEPTEDHDTVSAAIASLRPEGGTATGDALSAALDRLEARRGRDGELAPAAIVLLSDGKTTEGSDPVIAARRAGRLGIPISTVALGTADGEVSGGPFRPPISVPPDPQTLREIADESGGQAFEVEDAAELDRIYETLGSRIGTKREQREISAAFAGAGLLLLLGGLGAGLRWRGRLP